MVMLRGSGALRPIRRTDPPGQTDRTQTVHRPIRLLQRSAASLFFQNPSHLTRPDYKWVKRFFKTHH